MHSLRTSPPSCSTIAGLNPSLSIGPPCRSNPAGSNCRPGAEVRNWSASSCHSGHAVWSHWKPPLLAFIVTMAAVPVWSYMHLGPLGSQVAVQRRHVSSTASPMGGWRASDFEILGSMDVECPDDTQLHLIRPAGRVATECTHAMQLLCTTRRRDFNHVRAPSVAGSHRTVVNQSR